jgi:hypothetical protein
MSNDTKKMPNYVDKPMQGEVSVKALCLSDTGSKALHRFSSVAGDASPAIGSQFEFKGKIYRVVQVDIAGDAP